MPSGNGDGRMGRKVRADPEAPEVGEKMLHPFAALAKYATREGHTSIEDLDGCWIHRVDEDWVVAANGQSEPVKPDPEELPDGVMKLSDPIPPYSAIVWHRGWLIGMMDPGQAIFGHGVGDATVEGFIRALGFDPYDEED